MKFTIKKIIIWPKKVGLSFKEIEFFSNKLNIITGESRSGKSAIIPIVDYCLCSGKCRIPVDVIRNTVCWFGILIEKEEKEILICRKEPGRNDEHLKEMYFKVDKHIIIPETIAESNCNVEQAKSFLNNELGFSTERIDPDSDDYSGRPSLRDATSLIYQPQNIVANQNTLFYNADQPKHRKRLVKLFPYFLRYETVTTIKLKQEIEETILEIKRRERELKSINQTSKNWELEAISLLSDAKELGFVEIDKDFENISFDEKLSILERIISKNDLETLTVKEIKDSSDERSSLKRKEHLLSKELTELQNKLTSLGVLSEDINDFEKSLDLQCQRLEISKWIKEQCLNSESKYYSLFVQEELTSLCSALERLENKREAFITNPDLFAKEINLIQKRIETTINELNVVQAKLKNDFKGAKFSSNGLGYFYGRLKAKYEILKAVTSGGDIDTEIESLKTKLAQKQQQLESFIKKNNKKQALDYVDAGINRYIKFLDSERPNDFASLDLDELTLKIKSQSGKEDWLWELGSASNFLSYHLATMLSLQAFLQSEAKSVIPNFLILDQPSQVYFPDGDTTKDADKQAAFKIFQTLSSFVKENGKCEIIVLEHAGRDIWGGLDNINVSCNWRNGEKLIPADWIE